MLTCHVDPDGDALGSMLALTIALQGRGIETIASWGSDPFSVPRLYSYLPRLDLLAPPGMVPERPEVMITFDAGSFERLGTLEACARSARTLIVVDHHVSNDHFGRINLVDGDAAASAVLVYDVLERIGITITPDIATCIYTGIVTDTGRFQYQNTTPDVHDMVAGLLRAGARHYDVFEAVYNTHPVGYLKLAAAAIARIQVHPTTGIVWTWITQQDLADHGIQLEDVEALIDLVRTADVADVAAVLKQRSDGRYNVSMRSRGATNVGALCERLGGGGHALAAGFTSANGDPFATIEGIAASFRR